MKYITEQIFNEIYFELSDNSIFATSNSEFSVVRSIVRAFHRHKIKEIERWAQSRLMKFMSISPFHEEHQFSTAVRGADDFLGLQTSIKTARFVIVLLRKQMVRRSDGWLGIFITTGAREPSEHALTTRPFGTSGFCHSTIESCHNKYCGNGH